MRESDNLIEVNHLNVGYVENKQRIEILKNIKFHVKRGETLGIVGESGCGKSLTALAILGLLSEPLKVFNGTIHYEGTSLTALSKKEMNAYRGKQISMIFQEPMTSLNPVFTIGNQIGEAIRTHMNMPKEKVEEHIIHLLSLVKIPSPETRMREYPHQLSGGMRQRVMIAMVLACNPSLLIADEPTTALDVTIQSQILDLLTEIRAKKGMSMIFITHDLGVLSKVADRIIVMYSGRIVESSDIVELYRKPLHPYTQGLWKAIPSKANLKQRLYNIPGSVPNPRESITGCRFASRCPHVFDRCLQSEPELITVGTGHQAACFLYDTSQGGEILEPHSAAHRKLD